MPSAIHFSEAMQTFLEAGAGAGGWTSMNLVSMMLCHCSIHVTCPRWYRILDTEPQEDPVIHFFEGFLKYDSQIRKDRGVFYTPGDGLLHRPLGGRAAAYRVRPRDGSPTPPPGARSPQHRRPRDPRAPTPEQVFVQILVPPPALAPSWSRSLTSSTRQ